MTTTSTISSVEMQPGPTVSTASGAVRGTVENGLHGFRGIPYAEPPVGRLRFRPPEPRRSWDGVFEAYRFGNCHVQAFDAVEARLMGAASRPPAGPDCLNLNVWTPDLGRAPGLPVMVWIHGGSSKHGAGSDSLYDGSTFAHDGVVTVTLNYRLQATGFLYLPERPGAGAFGLLDQIAVLEWVQDNIAAFGGDPAQVTVAGESAGAHNIGQLLAAPAARGLFARAVLQSGACFYDISVERASALGTAVLNRLDVDASDDAGIADITDSDLLQAYVEVERRMFDVLAAADAQPSLMNIATGTFAA
jgi:para-nitrobenzyl esterase